MDDLAALDATAQADLVRRKQVKPIELVHAAIERIEALNPTLNAVVTPIYDEARKVVSRPLPQGPFTGVPFFLKDLGAEYAGARLTCGSASMSDYVSTENTDLVIRHKEAGLVVVGKTNTSEFGLAPTTEPRFHGPTHNPWDTTRTPGGSSGGSAAAVAAGLVPMAHGGDIGGSIRIPASCCGLFGLKPTRGRTPMGPDYADIGGLVQVHAITRSVRDSAALLDATAGPGVGDPYWAAPPDRPFLQEVGADPGRLRIAFSAKPLTGARVDPDCVAAVEDAAALCADLGHDVTEANPALDGQALLLGYVTLWSSTATWALESSSRKTGRTLAPEHFESGTWAAYEMGKHHSAAAFLFALQAIQRMSRDVARFLLDYDLWLTPTPNRPPPVLGTFDTPDNPTRGLTRLAEFVAFTILANATGQPAMSVPLYWNSDGLPIGAHFTARYGDEATLFRLAAQLEQARPWADRRPPVSAAIVSA